MSGDREVWLLVTDHGVESDEAVMSRLPSASSDGPMRFFSVGTDGWSLPDDRCITRPHHMEHDK